MDAITVERSSRCLRCGRPVCRARIHAAAQNAPLADFTPAQVAKASELIEEGGVLSTSRAFVYRSVGSDGVNVYLTHWAACTCPAGTRGLGRPCHHRAAVRILEAARTARRGGVTTETTISRCPPPD